MLKVYILIQESNRYERIDELPMCIFNLFRIKANQANKVDVGKRPPDAKRISEGKQHGTGVPTKFFYNTTE